MKFRVRRRYDRGVKLSERDFANAPEVVGEVTTHHVTLEDIGSVYVASINGQNRTEGPLLPELYRVELGAIAVNTIVLSGIERHKGPRGVHEAYQEWFLSPS